MLCHGEELTVARGRGAHTPKDGPWATPLVPQRPWAALGRRLRVRHATWQFGSIARRCGVRYVSHFAQAKVDPFRENDIHQADPVGAGCSRPQMRERFGEASCCIYLQQEISDPLERDLLVEMKHQVFGTCRRGGFELFNMQNVVFDRPGGNRACGSGAAKVAQSDIEPSVRLG